MKLPVIRGLIDRRILVNFRVHPDVLSRLIPAPFRPKLVNGSGMAGVCMIRLKQTRPRFLPAFLGLTSENAAHRIAVEWEENGETKEGVFVPRRDTSSRINALVGGRLFPGIQNHASFMVEEHDDHYRVELKSDDQHTHLMVEGHLARELTPNSVFGTLNEASRFFELGSVGYSTASDPDKFDGIELHSFNWRVDPLEVLKVTSSFFDDRMLFPSGSVEFDSALLMRGIDHEWRGKSCLTATTKTGREP